MRAVLRLPVVVQIPLAGSYSSALARSNEVTIAISARHEHLAIGSKVAVGPLRA